MRFTINGLDLCDGPPDLVAVARLFIPCGCTLSGFEYDEGIQRISYFTSDGLLRHGKPAFSQGVPVILHDIEPEMREVA